MVRILLTYNDCTYMVEILKVNDLPFPLLLGREVPAFGSLVRSALPQLTVVLQGDDRPGPGISQQDEMPVESETW